MGIYQEHQASEVLQKLGKMSRASLAFFLSTVMSSCFLIFLDTFSNIWP